MQPCQMNVPLMLTFAGLLFSASNPFSAFKVKSITGVKSVLTEKPLMSLCAERFSAAGFYP